MVHEVRRGCEAVAGPRKTRLAIGLPKTEALRPKFELTVIRMDGIRMVRMLADRYR